ncbi:unnamed protein product [Citrullus colocynthis]|uniref:Uncharacterized protein n=1 Tax=Citrullus colocynthis TaxID=252529 RepID=A0ABP0YXN3_9ROSI
MGHKKPTSECLSPFAKRSFLEEEAGAFGAELAANYKSVIFYFVSISCFKFVIRRLFQVCLMANGSSGEGDSLNVGRNAVLVGKWPWRFPDVSSVHFHVCLPSMYPCSLDGFVLPCQIIYANCPALFLTG